MDLSKYLAKPDKTIRQHTDDLIKNLNILNTLGYIRDEYIIKLTNIACEYHDYGKANKEFQDRIINKTRFDDSKEVAHNILSLYFLNENDFDNINDYYRVTFAILFHHYFCDNLKTLNEKEELSKTLLEEFEIYEIEFDTPSMIREMLKDRNAILIKGLVNKCDFSASGEFTIEYKNDFLVDSLRNLLEIWRKKNKNSNWNDLQLFCINNRNENIIAIAQTGMGKTEAGLHWIGNNKGFFILPLKTAINAIYKRVVEEILDKDIEHKIALLHSDSLSYYNSHKDNNDRDILSYHNESKRLSIPLSISTLDQLFDFVFKYKGYELKIVTLSYSKIVIDEIQMYGADLLAYLIYGIKTIIRFGGKVAILTATLAPFIKDLLNEGDEHKFKEGIFVNDIKRHNIKTYDSQIDSEIVYEKYLENKEKNLDNKILVVCNTVKKAQEIYKELSSKNIENLNILHSKFIKKERSEKEERIIKFGKTKNKGSGIWISTQIVEASLDIDFDYLFTELSDINGLFQRLGRCNRKGVKTVENHNCFIFLDIDKNLLTNGNKGFIDKKIYHLSKEALESVDGVLSEKEKIDIINKYLTTEKIKGSDYWKKYKYFFDFIKDTDPYEIDKKDIRLRNIVSFDIIPKVIYEENINEIKNIIEKLEKDKLECFKNSIVSNEILRKMQRYKKKEKTDKIILSDEIWQKIKSHKKKRKIEKIILVDAIKQFTVAVGKYDLDCLGESELYKQLEVNKYLVIDIMDCEYNELGFVRNSMKEEKAFDNFY